LVPAITGSYTIVTGHDRPVVTLSGVIHADHPGSVRFVADARTCACVADVPGAGAGVLAYDQGFADEVAFLD
jgi:hypothetical protein